MAGIKIVDLPPLGRDLASTDLLELSLAGGTGSRKITGQEIMNASKLSINNTPIINGTVGRVLFQGTGDVLQQSSSLFWDNTNARFGIGTSTPAYGLDVVHSVASLTARFSSPRGLLLVDSSTNTQNSAVQLSAKTSIGATVSAGFYQIPVGTTDSLFSISGNATDLHMSVFRNGNVAINTTTDAGYKLDVNGTTRISGALTIASGSVNTPSNTNSLGVFGGSAFNNGSYFAVFGNNCSTSNGVQQGSIQIFTDRSTSELNGGTYQVGSHSAGSAFNYNQIVFKSGNTWIGNQSTSTFPTDAGFRLDVNGTARVRGTGTSFTTTSFSVVNNANTSALSILDNLSVYFGGEIFGPNNFYINGPTNATGTIHLRPAILNLSTTNVQYNGTQFLGTGGGGNLRIGSVAAGYNILSFWVAGFETARIFNTGNWGINTTTDAGFTLDVNGTARVITTDTSTPLNIAHSGSVGIQIEANANGYRMRLASTSTFSDISTPDSYLTLNQSGQRVVIGSSTIYNSAQLAVDSTTRGFLPPRMTQAQRNAIASPAIGLEIYQTDATEGKYIYKSSGWTYIG